MTATLETFLAFEQCRGTAQLNQRFSKGDALKFTGFQQGCQSGHQGAVVQQQLIGEQGGEIKVSEVMARVVPATDGFQTPTAEVGLFEIGDRRPEQAVVLQREVFEVALTQLLTDRRPMTRAMQVQTQKISLATFPLTGFTGLFVTAGSTVPTLALDLLTEVLLELQSEATLATTASGLDRSDRLATGTAQLWRQGSRAQAARRTVRSFSKAGTRRDSTPP